MQHKVLRPLLAPAFCSIFCTIVFPLVLAQQPSYADSRTKLPSGARTAPEASPAVASPPFLTPSTTAAPGFQVFRKFLPPNTSTWRDGHSSGQIEDAWMPFRPLPPLALRTTRDTTWQFLPQDSSKSVLFVPVEHSLKFFRTFGWEETFTGLSPWSSRPDLEMVFVPMTESTAAAALVREAETALAAIPRDAEFWLPRMHFSLDTVNTLREKHSWFADCVDAWSMPATTVGVLWNPSERAGQAETATSLSLFDATPPISGLATPGPGVLGGCGDEIAGGTCGHLAFFGSACLVQGGAGLAVPPLSVQDVEGKVALVARGGCSFAEKVRVVKGAGAIAAIIYSDEHPRTAWLATEEEGGEAKVPSMITPESFPLALIDQAPGQWLRDTLVDSQGGRNMSVALFERTSAPWAFAADGTGHFRRLVRGDASLAAAILEATKFEYEALVAKSNPPAAELGLGATTVTVPVMKGEQTVGEKATRMLAKEVEIPSYVTERPNSGLHLRVHLMCPARAEENCPSLSSFVKLYACEASGGTGPSHRRVLDGAPGSEEENGARGRLAPRPEGFAPDVGKAQDVAPPPIDTSGGDGNVGHVRASSLSTSPSPSASRPPFPAAVAATPSSPTSLRTPPKGTSPLKATPTGLGGSHGKGQDDRVWEGCAGEVVELGRLVAPAGREMLTVVEASPFLAALPLKGDYRRGGKSEEYSPHRPVVKVFVLGADGYNVSLSLLFTAASPGDLVPFQTFRIDTSDPGTTQTRRGDSQSTAASNSNFKIVSLPKGVPSYSLVASITAEGIPPGSDLSSATHTFQVQELAPSLTSSSPPPSPLTWDVPLLLQSQPFGCSNLTLTRAGVIPNQLGDWYSSQPGFCPGSSVALKQFAVTRPTAPEEGEIKVVHLQGRESPRQGRGDGEALSASGGEGLVDLEAYVVTYAFLPPTPQVSSVHFVNVSTPFPPSTDPPLPPKASSPTLNEASVSSQAGRTTLTLRLPGPSFADSQDAHILFPSPTADTSQIRMPIDLYRVTLSERVSGDTFVYTFPVAAPPDLGVTSEGEVPVSVAPPNSQAVQVEVANTTAAIPTLPTEVEGGKDVEERGGARGLQGGRRRLPVGSQTEGQGASSAPPPSLPPPLQLVLRNLQPRTDYLVKIAPVSPAGPGRAAVLTVNVPGSSTSAPSAALRDGSPGRGPGGQGRKGDGPSPGTTIGLAMGLLGVVALIGVLAVVVWRRASPGRFVGMGSSGEEEGEDNSGEGLGQGGDRLGPRHGQGNRNEGEEYHVGSLQREGGIEGRRGGERPFPPRLDRQGNLCRSSSGHGEGDGERKGEREGRRKGTKGEEEEEPPTFELV